MKNPAMKQVHAKNSYKIWDQCRGKVYTQTLKCVRSQTQHEIQQPVLDGIVVARARNLIRLQVLDSLIQ